ncbi:hypothetical protein OBBRIDRAFT_879482 [Obba rivulosa]|uniref:SET domain-containing protein n=1 Tax=Obba rivulosa TaxID=1052685 RepID=A0A8E2DK34_9APHY|nr:hypothetical protein OBBRIDRAFT_879482 [Obba rivulosa]
MSPENCCQGVSVDFGNPVPGHLNSSGCRIGYAKGKGRGVYASRDLSAQSVVEISPVLLFAAKEYEEHGKHTVLDHYTFKWRDGRMALALGLGSLFNHSSAPNVSYTIDPATESIRYTTTRRIREGEELCIFYGHNLWFDPMDSEPVNATAEETDDGWGGLSQLDGDEEAEVFYEELKHLMDGNPDDRIPDEQLPFTRIKLLPDDEEEDELSAVHTEPAWAVDISDPKQTTTMLKWLKISGLETSSMSHLKRIRRTDDKMSILLTFASSSPDPPALPEGASLSAPYIVQAPRSAALTPLSLKHKSTFWPTVYAPRRKGEPEVWSRGKVKWACEAMREAVREARKASEEHGELPIASYVPVPYDAETREATQMLASHGAHDTRTSTSHPLRHSVLNVIRAVASYRASEGDSSAIASELAPPTPGLVDLDELATPSSSPAPPETRQNGSHYLLTSLTLFTTHEPCIMCSMALLHSRVKEIVYLMPMEKTGGCGSVTCVPKLEGVNHRYGVGVWRKGRRWMEETGIEVDEALDA